MANKTGCVYLVGAGCGTMDLITLRGLRLLQKCEVLVYDDLIDNALLAAAPADAERIYMGKRSGHHAAPQEEISAKLVEKGLEGKMVVRLKGGDPFVFGRGGEEILALQTAGVPYEEVPGISSSIAIPAAAGIPVTHRGASRSFHVITGHTAQTANGLPEEFAHYAALQGTLIFLMGLSHLEEIANGLMENGKSGDTPAAVVSGGNSPNPATVRATLSTIGRAAREAGVKSPAIIIVGQVAALDFAPTIVHPLQGVRVGLTGTDSVADKLKEQLEAMGAQTALVEHSVVEELTLPMELKTLCDGGKHWLVFTSSNGVRIFFRRLREEKLDLRRFSACKFAVIGKATGDTLAEYGICADLCPAVYTSAALAQELADVVAADEDVILLRSREGSAILTEVMQARKIPVQDVPLYTLHAEKSIWQENGGLPKLDYLTFSSSSGVKLYHEAYGALPEDTTIVCIGEVTAKAMRKQYGDCFLTAEEISVEGIVGKILEHHNSK